MSQQVKKLFPTQIEAERYIAEITGLRQQIETLKENHAKDIAERHRQYEINSNCYKDRILELQEKVIEHRDRLIEIEERFIKVLEREELAWVSKIMEKKP